MRFTIQSRNQIKLTPIKSNVGFRREGKTGVPGEKPTSRVENQQTQPTYDAEAGNRTRATLVGGECSTTGHPCSPGIGRSFYKSKRPGCYTFLTQTLNGTRIFSCWHGSNSLAPQEASLVLTHVL